MLCKYVLTVDSISYDIPKSCIQNWDEIKFSRKRSGLEGITRTFTSKFQFVGEAYDLILEEYLSKYLASNDTSHGRSRRRTAYRRTAPLHRSGSGVCAVCVTPAPVPMFPCR